MCRILTIVTASGKYLDISQNWCVKYFQCVEIPPHNYLTNEINYQLYRPEKAPEIPVEIGERSESELSTLIGPEHSRYCALIGWDHSNATPALLCHKEPDQGIQSPLLGAFLAFRWSLGGFHAQKGSIRDDVVGNIMIPLIIDSFCKYPPLC